MLCQIKIGLCYALGEAVDQSFEKAFKYYQLAADQKLYEMGSVEDQAQRYVLGLLGDCYHEGKGCEKSDDKSFKYFKLGADTPKVSSKFPLSFYKGDSYCQLLLGMHYEKGWGIEQSYENALYYYELAAQQGNPEALYYIGDLYACGTGVTKSDDEAYKFYRLSAERGFGRAYLKMGEYFSSKNEEKRAFEYYKMAAENGLAKGYYELGRYYQRLIGDENQERCRKYFRLAGEADLKNKFEEIKHTADQGEVKAQYKVGGLYASGLGVEKSMDLAFKYFKLAVQCEHPPALSAIASYYACGDAPEYLNGELSLLECLKKAIEYYERALTHHYNKEKIITLIEDCKRSIQKIENEPNNRFKA